MLVSTNHNVTDEITLTAGSFRRGEAASEMYGIVSGRVAILTSPSSPLATHNEQNCVLVAIIALSTT